MGEVLVSMEGIEKTFPGVHALSEAPSSYAPARCTPWSARTAPASRP